MSIRLFDGRWGPDRTHALLALSCDQLRVATPCGLLEDFRSDLEPGVARSAPGQLTGFQDPPPVMSLPPLGHCSECFEIDMRPRSEGDEERRHVMGDIHTAHARLRSLPGQS